jgi:DDE superfamily endonuclease
VLWRGAILTTGRRTITTILRTVRQHATAHVSAYHRVFSQRRWSAWEPARMRLAFLLNYVVPPGPVLLAGDETVAERPGPQVFGQGRHRDGVRSTHSSTAYRWGPKWVVVSGLVTLPFAGRPWALPGLVALDREPAWDQAHGTRHQTPAHLARRRWARVVRWFPARQGIFGGILGMVPARLHGFVARTGVTAHGSASFMVMPPCTNLLPRARLAPWDARGCKASNSLLHTRSWRPRFTAPASP